ncbi:MAG: hypothetical protein ISS57_04780 [Anaerolineales bacterium]|nr:hypothetical protein [Anaerolineales bacterium]
MFRVIRQIPIKRDLILRTKRLEEQIHGLNASDLRARILSYIERMQAEPTVIWEYKFAASQSVPVLYNATYAAMTLHLLNELQHFSSDERTAWVDYFSCYQAPDGLFKDPRIENDLVETDDWWGWRHLALQVIISITALGGVVGKPFVFLDPYLDLDYLTAWLENQDWEKRAAFASNAVQNIGVLLQYSRDYHANDQAGRAVECMLDWLGRNQDPTTGFWGESGSTPDSLSLGVQTGYHLWLLLFYDKRPIRCVERIIDSVLATQNSFGGFGVLSNSSACEDIDSIDPLVRLSLLTDYRREDIQSVLRKALPWTLVNMNDDGGFVFRRGERLIYGHERMSSAKNESALFPTWFRTLSLAYLAQVLPDTLIGDIEWQFVDCPGLQFFHQPDDGAPATSKDTRGQ